ncbi:hypothetical protein [Mesorhizobium mediterraneum]|uniref:hypothetical protein n=1 Tax=Mesorhizobium mediterraneum TaxID=43617 RepID=UPI0032DF1456
MVGFEHEADARRFWDMMRQRLQEFALQLHLEKTRLIEFGRYAAQARRRKGLGKPETFNFLGLRSSAARPGMAGSRSSGKAGGTAEWRS